MHITELSEHALHLLADAAATLVRKLDADTRAERAVNRRVREAEAVFGYSPAQMLHDKERAIAELKRFEAIARAQVWSMRAAKENAASANPIIGKRIPRRGH